MDTCRSIYTKGIIDLCRKKWSFSCVAIPLISIVDDDESVREALCGLLRSVGAAVNSFASAEEFLSFRSTWKRELPGTGCAYAGNGWH